MRSRRQIAFIFACALGASASIALAQDPSARQAALVLRILSYDRNLPQRASGNVTVLVAYRRGDSTSEGEQQRMVAALSALGRRTTVANMRAQAVALAYTDAASLTAAAQRESAAAVYVCHGLDSSLGDIRGVARELDILTLSPDASAVRGGLSVGLVASGGEVQLIVNLRALEAEGARLDATVLRLAQVIR